MKKGNAEEKLEKLLVDFTENLTGKASGSTELSSEEFGSMSVGVGDNSSLFETIQTISSAFQSEQPFDAFQPKQPSEEFAANLIQAAQERLQEQMTAQTIQRIISMAITDADFRKSFFNDVVTACRNVGFDLTPQEVAALRNLKEDDVEKFANSLDERITKFFPASLS